MNSPQVTLEISDQVSPDFLAGLRLYAELAMGDASAATIDRWLYWYRDNPFGPGLYALAKHGPEVVGIYTLIPIEMRLRGQNVLGAKGEAFAVRPEFRAAIDPDTGMPLPLALVCQLNRHAEQRCMHGIVAVSNRAAAACHRFSGATPVEYPAWTCEMFFTPPKVSPARGRRQWLRARGAWLASGLLRQLGRVCGPRPARGGFQLVDRITSAAEGNGHDMLLSSSGRMLNFRFPADRHLIYQFHGDGGSAEYLIFSRPEKGADAWLRHWTTSAIRPAVLAAVVGDVIARCRAARAASLKLVIPEDEAAGFAALGRMGFLRRRQQREFYLYLPSASDERDDRSWRWRFTFAHVGFF